MVDNTEAEANQSDNEDWIKGHSWDFYEGDGPLTSLVGLLEVLGVSSRRNTPLDEQQKAVKHFMTLRSSLAMPDSLRVEVEKFLAS